jgi:hypothetical protein
MTKHKEYFDLMLSENKEVFEHFQKVHDVYVLNPKRYQVAYNVEGAKVIEIMHEYEKKLCMHSEKGQYAKYSSKIAEKFWEIIRKKFSKIDFVGVTYS